MDFFKKINGAKNEANKTARFKHSPSLQVCERTSSSEKGRGDVLQVIPRLERRKKEEKKKDKLQVKIRNTLDAGFTVILDNS